MPIFPALAFVVAIAAPADDFPKLWSDVSKAISGMYFAKETRKADVERLLAKYKPIAEGASDRAAFAHAVNDMIAEFGDSHFAFYTNDDQGYYAMDYVTGGDKAKAMPNIGAWFKSSPDGYTVQMVVEGTSAQKAGLRKGDVIATANGKPFLPVASFHSGGTVKLEVNRGGSMLPLTVDTTSSPAGSMFLDGSRASVKVIDYQGKKVGYIHLWMMLNDQFRNVVSSAIYGRLKDTDACILDLRDGFGGRPEGFADPFFRPAATLEWKGPMMNMEQTFGYAKPLVVITNEGSRSAKEVISQILKDSKRATLVGGTTAGHVLGTFPLKLNDWAYLEIPMVDVITNGIRLEGKGVTPDVPVAAEFDKDGNDLFLAKALEVVAAK